MNDAPRAQEIMINKVNFYEEKCLDELRIDSETCKYLEKIIETIKERLNDTVWIEVYAKASDVSELDKMAYETLCKIEKRLFLGRSFVFLKKNLFQNCEIETFGKLLIVQDEFIGKRAIQKLQYLEKREAAINSTDDSEECCDLDLDEPDDFRVEKIDSDILKSLYLIQYIKDNMESIEPVEDVVLQSESEEVCIIKYYRLLTEIDSNLFSGMNSLKTIVISLNYDLKSLQVKNLFEGLNNLTRIDLSFNSLSDIGSNLFKGLENIKEINLSNNCLRSIKSGYFNDLINLTRLTINYNEIITIEPGSFQGLVNLKTIYLCGNELKTLDKGIFKCLNKLETISLLCNPITSLDAALFQNLENLSYIALKDGDNLKAAHDLISGLTDELEEKFKKSSNKRIRLK